MEATYKVQARLRQELGLRKITAASNKNYQRDGTRSYAYLMNRFGFQPTKAGPYSYTTLVHHRGLASGDMAPGGPVKMRKTLIKKEYGTNGSMSIGEVSAADQQNDSMYLCEVQIGTPPQKVRLDFDTGSSDLWVFSPSLPSHTRANHNTFNPKESSTWKPDNVKTWKIQYGDGSFALGGVGTDTLQIGGLMVKNQTIELASRISSQFSEGTGDGLLGLAFSQINTVMANGHHRPAQTPVANMIEDNDIPKDAELFTSAFYSSRDQAPNSFYTFGWIDKDLVNASGQDIHWTAVDSSQGFWMVPSASATIGSQKLSLDNNTAIVDTGTSLALVSDEVCDALYSQIDGAEYNKTYQGYTIPISSKSNNLPNFSVAIGDKEFIIQKEDLLFSPVDDNNWYGGVQSRGDNPFDILGDTFLKSIYAVWDQGNKRFGCVRKIEKSQNLNPPQATN